MFLKYLNQQSMNISSQEKHKHMYDVHMFHRYIFLTRNVYCKSMPDIIILLVGLPPYPDYHRPVGEGKLVRHRGTDWLPQ